MKPSITIVILCLLGVSILPVAAQECPSGYLRQIKTISYQWNNTCCDLEGNVQKLVEN